MIPAAFTKPTGEAHWELLVRTRAVENQCYVLAAAQAGRHNEKRESFGCSLIVDPWGTVVARLDGLFFYDCFLLLTIFFFFFFFFFLRDYCDYYFYY